MQLHATGEEARSGITVRRKWRVRFYPAELGGVCELIRPGDTDNSADTSCWISLSLFILEEEAAEWEKSGGAQQNTVKYRPGF